MEENKQTMNQIKINFIKTEFTKLLSTLQPETKGKWGKMNAQQMAEHMSNAFRWASGEVKLQAMLTPEQTQKTYAFMMSDKPFKENTPNQLLPDVPAPFKHVSMKDAIAELQKEIDHFAVQQLHPS